MVPSQTIRMTQVIKLARLSFKKVDRLKQTLTVSLRLLSLLWSIDKWLLIGNVVAVVIPALVPFLIAYIFKLLLDRAVLIIAGNAPDLNAWGFLLAAVLGAFILQSVAFSAQEILRRLMFTRVPISFWNKILEKISTLDLAYFEDPDFKVTLEKCKESYTWRPLNMLENLLFSLQSLIQIVVATVVLAWLNPWLILIVVAISIPRFVANTKQSKKSWSIWDVNSGQRNRVNYISDILQERNFIKELRIFNLQGWFLKELNKTSDKFYAENKKVALKYFAVNTAINILEAGSFIGMILYIFYQAIQKFITVGDVNFYISAVTNFQNGINGLVMNVIRLFEQSLYLSSMFEVLDAQPILQMPKNPVTVDPTKAPLIEFKNVSFHYPASEKLVFKNLNITIKPGQKIALVGENGVGKTTFVKLLCRFYDVTDGEILINGTNIKDLDLLTWYQAIGVLFQDFVRYEYPAKDNIAFGKVKEKDQVEKIIEAAVSSGADPVIKKLKNGYEQMLGQRFKDGTDLSGGQWQKVALARAFFRNSPLLILDEPTAAIDAKAETEIFNRVEKLSKDKSVLIISHRFSTVRNADQIYVINDGEIFESGSHKQLMKQNGQYAHLFNLQAAGYQ